MVFPNYSIPFQCLDVSVWLKTGRVKSLALAFLTR